MSRVLSGVQTLQGVSPHFKILLLGMFAANNTKPSLLVHIAVKVGSDTCLTLVMLCLQKNLNIIRLCEIMIRNGDTFDQEWNTFVIDLR